MALSGQKIKFDHAKIVILNDFELVGESIVVRRDPAATLDIQTITALFAKQREGKIESALAWQKELDTVFEPLDKDWR